MDVGFDGRTVVLEIDEDGQHVLPVELGQGGSVGFLGSALLLQKLDHLLGVISVLRVECLLLLSFRAVHFINTFYAIELCTSYASMVVLSYAD